MKVTLYKNQSNVSYDITNFIDGITWSGDYQQVARTLEIGILFPTNDMSYDRVNIEIGDKVKLEEHDLELFYGRVWNKNVDSSSQFIKITCYDDLIYMTKSQIVKVYTGVTPEGVTKQLCNEFNITAGSLASTGYSRNYVALGQTPYDVIMASYTYASKKNGKKYMPRMMNRKLHVIEKGTSQANVILDPKYNLQNIKYDQSLDKMINSVIVYKNDDGSTVLTETKQDWINKYGKLQKTMTYEEEKDNRELAKKEISDLQRKAEAKAFGHPGCIAGNIVYVRDEHTGLIGKFYIDSDSHTWNQGVHNMTLTLNFENLMDEKELEEELQKNDSGRSDDSDDNKGSISKPSSGSNSSVTNTWYHTNIPGHGPDVNPK